MPTIAGVARRCFLLAALWLAVGISLVAPGVRNVSLAAETDASLAASAQFAHDAQAERKLAHADSLLEQERYREAVLLLQELLDAPQDSWIGSGSNWRSLKQVVRERILSLPAAGRHVYLEFFDRPAAEAFENARSANDTVALKQVAARYPATSAAVQALAQQAATHLHRGEWRLAALGFERLIKHPLSPQQNRQLLYLQTALAWSRAGEQARADAWRKQLASENNLARLRLGGLPRDTNDWWEKQSRSLVAEPADDWRLERGNPQRNRVVADSFPAAKPTWRRKWLASRELSMLLDQASREYRAQGLVGLPSSLPVAVGDRFFARTPTGLIALHALTGEVLWEVAGSSDTSRLNDESAALQNPGFRGMVTDQLVRQVLANTAAGALASDGERLLATEEQPLEGDDASRDAPMLGNVRNGTPPLAWTRLNRLSAYSLTDGSRLWSVGGPREVEAPDTDPLLETYFLGPPLPLEGRLYVLGQSDSQVRLFALRAADGSVEWWLPLVESLTPIAADPVRRALACPVAVAEGLLLCPTGAGCVAAVDLATRSRAWGYRYQRDDSALTYEAPAGRLGGLQTVPLNDGWNRIAAVVSAGRLVVASPESDELHVLDLHTGKLLWKRPREEGLYVAAVDDTRVIVVGKHVSRAYALDSGALQWSAAVGTPAGLGVASAGRYLLPLEQGGLVALDLESGAVVRGAAVVGEPLGNLLPWKGGMLAVSRRGVERFDSWTSARDRFEAALATATSPEQVARTGHELVELERHAGDWSAAAERLRRLRKDDDSDELRAELLAVLHAEVRSRPERLPALSAEAERLLSGTSDRVEWLHTAARAHAARGAPLDALATYFRLLSLSPDDLVRTTENPITLVRRDHAVQGEIADLFASVSAEMQARLDRAFHQHRQAASDSADPFALQRFADQFGDLPWGWDVRIQLAEKAGIGVSFLRAELALLELTRYQDRAVAGRSLARIAELMENRSFRADAAHYYRRLRDEFADHPIEGERTGKAIVTALPAGPLVTAIQKGPRDEWPRHPPQISTKKQRNAHVHQVPIPLAAPPGSLGDRLSLLFDRQTRRLRFRGGEHPGTWELKLPDSKSPLRDVYQYYRGWCVGHLLVLRIGSQILAVAPLNEAGEPEARILWMIETLTDDSAAFRVRTEPGKAGFGDPEIGIFDRFGREAAGVGPVCAGYLCYQQKGKLIALETATGQPLWERHDLPTNCLTVGDEEFLYLLPPGSRRVEVVRALDGKTLTATELDFDREEMLTISEGRALVQQSTPDGESLRLVRLRDGRDVWRHAFARGTQPFGLDAETVGIWEPARPIRLLRIRDGEVIASTEVADLPARVTEIYTVADAHRWYAVFSGPMANPRGPAPQIRGGFRNPRVNGVLCAWDRQTGELSWTRRLQDVTFPLDQPRDAPVFVLNFSRLPIPARDETGVQGVIRCLDRRTGRDLFHLAQPNLDIYCTLDTNVEQQWVDLQLATQTIRLDFGERGEPIPQVD